MNKNIKGLSCLLTLAALGLAACGSSESPASLASSSEPSSGVDTSSAASSNSNLHTVTFDSNGGTPVAPQVVEHGEKLARPQDPEKEGHTFNGWYYQGEVWSFAGYVVTEDMTLKAEYTICHYSIDFDDFDPAYGSVDLIDGVYHYEYGASVTMIAKPHSGFSFAGYYDSDSGTLLSNDPDYTFTIKRDMNVRVEWKKGHGPYSVGQFKREGGSVSLSKTRAIPGETINITFQPDSGYRLGGASVVIDEKSRYSCPNVDHDISVQLGYYHGERGQTRYDHVYIYLWNDAGEYNAKFPGQEIMNESFNFVELNKGRSGSDRFTKFIITAEGELYEAVNGYIVRLSRLQTIDLTVADWAGSTKIEPFDTVALVKQGEYDSYYATPVEADKSPYYYEGNEFTMTMPDGGVMIDPYFDNGKD